MKKLLVLLVALALVLTLAACGNGGNDRIEVTILGTIKSEIGPQFEEAVEAYNDSQETYEIVVVDMDGQNAFEKMTSLYASNNAPTIMVMGQEMADFEDRLLDLSDTEFIQKAFPGTTDNATYGDRVLGMPVTVEGFGLLYNKEVLDSAIDGDFDPADIKNRTDLKDLFDAIEADGNRAVHLSPMDWSLGAHVSNKFFGTTSENHTGRVQVLEDLKAGNLDLNADTGFNGWLDTLDLLIEYNENAASPLSPDYDAGTVALSSGEVGFWFMGNWAYPSLNEFDPDGTYGIMPYPVSAEDGTYGNDQISVGVPMYIVVDEEQSTEEEQAGAIDFLTWLVTDPVGQDYYVNEMLFIPVFEGFNEEPTNFMAQEIARYTSEGNTLEWVNSLYPADGWPTMGASMQKYVDGVINRDALATEIEDYWKEVE